MTVTPTDFWERYEWRCGNVQRVMKEIEASGVAGQDALVEEAMNNSGNKKTTVGSSIRNMMGSSKKTVSSGVKKSRRAVSRNVRRLLTGKTHNIRTITSSGDATTDRKGKKKKTGFGSNFMTGFSAKKKVVTKKETEPTTKGVVEKGDEESIKLASTAPPSPTAKSAASTAPNTPDRSILQPLLDDGNDDMVDDYDSKGVLDVELTPKKSESMGCWACFSFCP
ncbi:MAG: hypothetical protein SGARI_004431 [Bacillariaceae sp.]